MGKRKRAGTYLLLFALALAAAGCATTGEEVRPEVEREEPEDGRRITRAQSLIPQRIRAQESMNVYALQGEDWKAAWNPEPVPPPQFAIGGGAERERRIAHKRGWRVQLFNEPGKSRAQTIAQRAQAFFDTVYVEFQSPNYRVRVGDFVRRSAADRMARTAKGYGFRQAWVVPDRVIVYEN